MSGIVSFNDSLLLKGRLSKTSREIQSSVIQLASGQRVNQAADDIPAYVVGSFLSYNMSALNTGLNNVTQAQSILSIASDNLQTIYELLQTQQSLASQASAGTLTDSELAALNAQFSDISDQIDQIATSTSYNSINLLDGSLGDASIVSSDTSTTATPASGTAVIVTALAATDTLSINGATFTASAGAVGLLGLDVTAFTTATQQASALLNAINTLKTYNGTNAAYLTAKAALSQVNVTNPAAGTLYITASSGGTAGNSIVVQTNQGAAADFTLNGVNAGASAGKTLSNGTNGSLNDGTFSAGATAYSGTAQYIAQGSISAGLLKPLTLTTQGTTGVDVSNISNNTQFIGTLPSVSVSYGGIANSVNLSVTVGNYTYVANGVNTNYTADTIVTFQSTTSGGGSFNLQFAANGGSNVTNATEASRYASALNGTLSNISIYQKRTINFTPSGTVYPTGSNVASGDLTGSTFELITNNFNNIKVQDVGVVYSATGNAIINVTINGEVYSSGYNPDGSTSALTNSITNASGVGGKIGLTSQHNTNNILTWKYASATNLSITNLSQAQGLEKSLKQTFGIITGNNSNTGSGINIQVGSKSGEIINFTIGGATTRKLYLDDNNNYSAISVSSVVNAQAATDVLNNALSRISYLQSEVGAKVNRFDYAQATLESTISNLDAARSGLMDTDVVSESSNLSSEMAKYSAGILSMAQLNNMKSSLLKLLDK